MNATATIAANKLILNKRCEFVCDQGNAWVPLGHCSASNLLGMLNEVAGDSVEVQFHTTEKESDIAEDVRKYSRRLDRLMEWDRTEWEPKVVRGVAVSRVYVCTLTRRKEV